MVKNKKVLKTISKINDEFWVQTENEEIYLDFHSNGMFCLVKFLGVVLWNSENDERRYFDSDKLEDLEVYLRRKINSLIDEIQLFKLNKKKVENEN